MNDIVAVTASNVFDTDIMKYLLESAKINKFKVEVIGVNKPFTWMDRMKLFREYLINLPDEVNQIVCFTEASDTFYLSDLESIRQKFLQFKTDIVWAVEKWPAHLMKSDEKFYDKICRTSHGYKFLTTSAFIGYKNALLEVFNDVLEVSLKDNCFIEQLNNSSVSKYGDAISGLDQTWISHHLVNNWLKYKFAFDYECDLFYISSGDWLKIDNAINSVSVVTTTGKSPNIIRVPWKKMYENILVKLFYQKYTNYNIKALVAGPYCKQYTWLKNSITFFDHGIMDAFGNGTYSQLEDQVFQAIFCGRKHKIIFNSDYSEFVSTREGDNNVVKGNFIKNVEGFSYKIVVARLNEDIEWLKPKTEHCVIYNKGGRLNIKNEILMQNIGGESQTYLNYIIDNYNNLPDVVVFTKGKIADSTVGDRIEYLNKLKLQAFKQSRSQVNLTHRVCKKDTTWTEDWNLTENFRNNKEAPFVEWYIEHIDAQIPNPIFIYGDPIFAIKKDVILNNPIEYYRRLILEVGHHMDPTEARYMKRSWYHIFNTKGPNSPKY